MDTEQPQLNNKKMFVLYLVHSFNLCWALFLILFILEFFFLSSSLSYTPVGTAVLYVLPIYIVSSSSISSLPVLSLLWQVKVMYLDGGFQPSTRFDVDHTKVLISHNQHFSRLYKNTGISRNTVRAHFS